MTNRLFIVFMCCGSFLFSQQNLLWPITKVNLTGNYGEIRPNHFHSGLDFVTEGGINQPIYAVSDGYVSRIKISPYGYGKVIYISHPGGLLSVYAHQNRFNTKIEVFVKSEQYQKQSFEIELFPSVTDFPVKQGELIGYSGNTGGSTGPHLHFELRNEITEIPLNPLLYFKLSDTVKPTVNTLTFCDLSDPLKLQYIKTARVKSKRDSLYCANDSIVLNNSVLGIAFCGEDKEIVNGNPNNIYEVKLYFDGNLIYHHQLNYVSFDNARYVNEFSDIIEKQKVQKCFAPKLYPLDLYKTLINSGKIELKDTLFHFINMQFTDEASNNSDLKFYLKTTKFNKPIVYVNNALYLNCVNSYSYQTKNFEFHLPAKALYNDVVLKIKDDFKASGSITIEPENVNFRTAGTIKIQLSKQQVALSDKLVLISSNSTSIPFKSGTVNEYNLKNFGKFKLLTDTTAPKIKTSIPIKKLKKIFKSQVQLSFLITDNLSGIGGYAVFVNNKWVLTEYDAKSNTLSYFFDSTTPSGELAFRVEVKDKVGNNSVYNLSLQR